MSLGGSAFRGFSLIKKGTYHEQNITCTAVNSRALGFVVVAGAAIAVVQALATLLVLAVVIFLVWAVCFRTREVLVTMASLVVAYLLAAYPVWCAATLGLAALGRWLKGREPPTPKPKLLPPPTGD